MPYEMLKQELYKNIKGINTKVSEYTTDEMNVLDLRNFCFERPGGWQSRPGSEYFVTLSKASLLVKPQSTFQYAQNTGNSFIIFDSGSYLWAYNGASFSAHDASLTAGATMSEQLDLITYNNFTYYANGIVFRRFDGATIINWRQGRNTIGLISGENGLTFNTSLTAGATSTIASGTWITAFNPVRGLSSIYDPPAFDVEYRQSKFFASSYTLSNTNVVTSFGSTTVSRGKWVVFGFSIQPFFGISGILPALIRQADGLTVARYATPIAPYLTLNANGVTVWHAEFSHLDQTIWPENFLGRDSISISPKFLEIYNNHLFAAGATATPQTIYFSEPGDPETVYLENQFEVLTNDNSSIIGLKVFQDAILIFKEGAVFELSGNDAQSFSLRKITSDYGLLNNRSVVVFENKCWFVDQKGIIQYDGANFTKVSDPIESFLNQLDKSTISAVHLKAKSQVWFTSSSISFVYDYLVGAWSIYDGHAMPNTAGVEVLRYGPTRTDVSYWKSGTSFWELPRFGDSLTADFGSAITLVIKTKYHKRLGDSTQEMWRRLYINSNANDVTLAVTLSFYPDYQSTPSLIRSDVLTAFQERIDFGVSSRSLSVEMILKSSSQVKINGYTLESRYLRSV